MGMPIDGSMYKFLGTMGKYNIDVLKGRAKTLPF